MKILLISPTQSGIGGISQHVQGLTKFLQNEGHDVEIISSENTFTVPIKGLKNLSFMISSVIKSKFKKNFDIIHAHNIPAALAMKQMSGKKILTIHGVYSKQIEQLHGNATAKMSNKLQFDALSWADAITVISKEAYDYYSDLKFDVKQIPNAIDTTNSTLSKKKIYEKQIVFAGRLSKEKGIQILIEVCKRLPETINLIIVGSGPEEHDIQNLSLEKDNVHYLGQMNHEDTLELIKNSDILFQPSLSEGISTTILEAMISKTCILASNVGGNSELIENKKSGILVESLDYNSFLKELINLINNPDFCKQLSDLAFEKSKEYCWSVIGKKYLKLYNQVLDGSTK